MRVRTILDSAREVPTEIHVGSIVADNDGEHYEVREVFETTVKAVKETFSNPIYTLEKKEIRVL